MRPFLPAIPALLAFALAAPAAAPTSVPLPAFPGAMGFGASASGGRGGAVYHVTNLNDAGPGSFRDAVSQGRRTVVFDVGGAILLQSTVQVAGDITLAGQTAPGDGIALYGREVSFSGAHNVIARFLRFRLGLTPGQEHKYTVALGMTHDVILDHCSIEWGRWDCVGLSKSSDVTLQDCIIGESIDPQRFGCLCESDNVTFARDLWIDNQSRNPKSKGHVQYVNNVVYDWGVVGYVGGHSAADHAADLLNNDFIAGPQSSARFVGEFAPTDHIYQSGNVVDLDHNGKMDGRPVSAADFGGATVTATPWAPLPPADSAAEAYKKVIAGAGCSLHRDAIDARLISEVESQGTRGQITHDPAAVGGPAPLRGGPAPADADGDGIPDAWERAHPAPASRGAAGAGGYTALETYINSLAGGEAAPAGPPRS